MFKIIEAGKIGAGEFGLMAFDNQGWAKYAAIGAISWQILNENGYPWRVLDKDGRTYNGRRLNIGFKTYWK